MTGGCFVRSASRRPATLTATSPPPASGAGQQYHLDARGLSAFAWHGRHAIPPVLTQLFHTEGIPIIVDDDCFLEVCFITLCT